MAGHPPTAQKITVTSQATAGSVLGTAYFPPGRTFAQVYVYNPSSTKIDYMAQWSIADSSVWVNAWAAPSSCGSTAGLWTKTTYTNLCFDRLRIYTTDAWSATTIKPAPSYTFWVDAR